MIHLMPYQKRIMNIFDQCPENYEVKFCFFRFRSLITATPKPGNPLLPNLYWNGKRFVP